MTYQQIHESENKENVRRAILAGKGTRTIAKAYQVSEQFVIKCRYELRNEGLL